MSTDKARSTAAFRGQWLDQVAADPRMSGAGLRFCIILAHYFNGEHGKAWASYDRMAQDFNIERTAIIRGAKKAEELGHVEIKRLGGQKGSDYIPLLTGTKIVSNRKAWSTRHRPINGAKSSTANGARSSTIKQAEKPSANGGRFEAGMVDDIARNGARSSTLTLYEPPTVTLEGVGGRPADPSHALSGKAESYDPTSAGEGSALHRGVPFNDQCDLPLSAENRSSDTGLGPDRPSDLVADAEEVWNDLWSAWPWIDDEVEARSAFDSALRETSAKKIADAYNRGDAGSGDDFTDMIGAVLASLRRAAA